MSLTSKTNNTPSRWLGRLLPAIAMVCLSLFCVESARAQLTAKQLLASAVSDYGKQYQDVEDAIVLFRKGDFAGFRKSLDAAKKKNPQLAPVDVMQAQLLFSIGQAQAGRTLLERVIEAEASDPEAYIMLGDLALRQRRLTEAEQMFEKGKAYCDDFKGNDFRRRKMQVNAYAGLSAVSEARQNWKQAIARLTTWIEADPKNSNAHARMGQALFQADRASDAYASFLTAREINDKAPLAEINMAILYQQSGDQEKADKLMDAAIKKAPEDINTRLAVGSWALKAGKVELALASAQAAQKLESDNILAKLLLGMVARNQNDAAAAIAAFESVLAESPRNFAAMNHLALTLIDQKSEKERVRALGYAQLNAQININRKFPTGREALATLAWVQFRLGNEQIAQKQIQGILNTGPVSSESAYYAARIFESGGRPDIASKILQQSLLGENAFPHRDKAESLLIELNVKIEKALKDQKKK